MRERISHGVCEGAAVVWDETGVHDLPHGAAAGADKLPEDGTGLHVPLQQRKQRSDLSRNVLTVEEEIQIDKVVEKWFPGSESGPYRSIVHLWQHAKRWKRCASDQKAAKQEDATAQSNLGVMFENDRGVSHSVPQN